MLYCKEKSKNTKVRYDFWYSFAKDYTKKMNISNDELWNAFARIKRTGFVEEEFETESGDVDQDDNTFDSLQVESNGYCLSDSFLRFYDIVLKQED